MFNNKHYACTFSLLFLLPFLPIISSAQNNTTNYKVLFNKKQNREALESINKRLEDIYSKRIEYKIIFLDFVTMKQSGHSIDLKKIFRERKARGFFIEENKELQELHQYAARCYYELKNYKHSINHYYQSMRYKKIELSKDDIIFYELAQVYKKSRQYIPYINSLETAYTLNPKKSKYSYELGIELSAKGDKKKALYYLMKYIELEENISPKIYLKIGNLNEDLGNYLDTLKFYRKYIGLKKDDPYVLFAAAYIAYDKTGNFELANDLFDKSLKYLSEKEIYRRSKAYEYKGDMAWKNLNFKTAVDMYSETIKYQGKIKEEINRTEEKIKKLDEKLKKIKASLFKNRDYDEYSSYEILLEDKGNFELKLKRINNEYNKLNPGRVRWYIADSLERLDDLKRAIGFYRQAIKFNYRSNRAREKITKIELKIIRGY